MRLLSRAHIWLGWLVGIPLIFWTISGLFMVSQPIETVRGEHLKTPPPPIIMTGLQVPQLSENMINSMQLISQHGKPVWIINTVKGRMTRADGLSGLALPEVEEAEARALAKASFAGSEKLTAIQRFSADDAPIDLRRPRASWQALFDDGTHIYIDAATGQTLATRSQLWRTFDFMWGLHIMDLQSREDTSHPLLIIFAALAFLTVFIGLILLFRAQFRGRGRFNAQKRA